jgi:hypothetical protein
MCATGMYYYLSKISSQIYVLNSGYLSSGQYIYVSKDVVIFVAERGPRAKCLGNAGLDDLELPFQKGLKILVFFKMPRLTLAPTQSPIQWLLDALF